MSVITWGLSTHAGVHYIYFTFAGVWPVMFGIERWRVVVSLTILAIIAFFLNEAWFQTPGLSGADATLIDIVRYTWAPNAFTIILVLVLYFHSAAHRSEQALEREHDRSEQLLHNLLPLKIADRLKQEPNRIIADNLGQVTILFADIVDFTPRASSLSAANVVRFLNRIFTEFDVLVDAQGLEKIKTIGDAYMVAAGLPEPRADQAQEMARLAFDMLAVCKRLSAEQDERIRIRIGIHTGPAVAGVIGTRKFFYDVWGDTVNVASRLESLSEPGRVHVTQETIEALGDGWRAVRRRSVEVKGKGLIDTFWLEQGPLRSPSASTPPPPPRSPCPPRVAG